MRESFEKKQIAAEVDNEVATPAGQVVSPTMDDRKEDASTQLYEKYQALVAMHEQNYADFKST